MIKVREKIKAEKREADPKPGGGGYDIRINGGFQELPTHLPQAYSILYSILNKILTLKKDHREFNRS